VATICDLRAAEDSRYRGRIARQLLVAPEFVGRSILEGEAEQIELGVLVDLALLWQIFAADERDGIERSRWRGS
jgi:hypothetical protein